MSPFHMGAPVPTKMCIKYALKSAFRALVMVLFYALVLLLLTNFPQIAPLEVLFLTVDIKLTQNLMQMYQKKCKI